jgi:hypothetical protein
MDKLPTYLAFGLQIEANFPLRLPYGRDAADLSIQYSQTDISDIFPFLMEPGLATALHLRGVPLLHGAAVVLNGKAILISGHSEMGESTLTARLMAAGLALLTEDLTPVTISNHAVRILPGYPGLQLHADAIRSLGFNLADCPKVYPGLADDNKRWLDITRLAGNFHPSPAPLQMIYVLSGRRRDLTVPQITSLSPTQACLALLDHLYGTRWLDLPTQQTISLCARLAERVQVRRVWTPEGLDTVAATAQALIDDAKHNTVSVKPTQKGIP